MPPGWAASAALGDLRHEHPTSSWPRCSTGSVSRGQPLALLAAFVFERDLELRPIRQSAVLANLNVLFDNLGDPQVTKRPARRLDGSGRGVLPGLGASTDEFGHPVNAHINPLALRRLSSRAVLPQALGSDKTIRYRPRR